MRRLAPLAFVLLCACGQGREDPGPGAVTADEARALDEATEMLKQRRLSPEQLRNVPAVDTAPVKSNEAQRVELDAGR